MEEKMILKDTKLPNNYKLFIVIIGLCIETMMLLFFCGQMLNSSTLNLFKHINLLSGLCIFIAGDLLIGYLSYYLGEQIAAMALLTNLELEN